LDKSIKRFTVNGLQQLFTLMLPFELSDAGLLGNIFQLAPGFVTLRLESESGARVIARGGVVVRLRGVVRQGSILNWRRSRIPLDKAENTKKIIRNRKKSRKNCRGS
jgi:hypothetical protein